MKQYIDLLIQLQSIDSAGDAIEDKKGSLPKDLARLESQLQELTSELEGCKNKISQQKELIVQHKETDKKATELIARHNQEHLSIISNKEEYDSITREIALQELNIKLAKKKIKTCQAIVSTQNERIEELQKLIQESKRAIQLKKEALVQIEEKTREQEAKLYKQREEVIQKIQDPSLTQKYESRREHFRLVVARVVQEACNGCFIIVPSQRQIKINEAKQLFMCESCDRMLVQVEEAPPEEERPTRMRRSASV